MTVVSPPPRTHTFVLPDPLATVLDVLSPTSLLATAQRYRWLLIAATLGGAALSLIRSLRVEIKYTATARFVMSSSSGSPVSSLAAALGLPAGGGGSVFESPNFFVDLLKSREILWSTANSPMQITGDSARIVTPIQYLGISNSNPIKLKNSAVNTLRSFIDAKVGPNGAMELNVTTKSPEFSSALANAVLEAGNRFIYETRQRRIAGDRPFIERRLEMAQQDLRDAEARLKEFMRTNRQYQNSPDLMFQYNHLTSEVSMRQQFFQSAQLASEQTKIEEIRNTPVTSVFEAPDPPERPDRKINKKSVIMAAAAGFVLAAFIALVLDLRRRVAFERAIAS